jgi:hypothetical protein
VSTDQNIVWTVSPHVRTTLSEDGAVLLDIEKGICYSLNVVAARIWTTIQSSPNGIGFQGLLDTVQGHFNNSQQELKSDIDEYLGKLEKMGLVHGNGKVPSTKALRIGR